MIYLRFWLIFILCFFKSAQAVPMPPLPYSDYHNSNLPIERRVQDLLSQMTLEEKLGQLELGFSTLDSLDPAPFTKAIAEGQITGFIAPPHTDDPAFRNALQKMAMEQSRLGIPLLFGIDTIHGFRTIFPISLGLSCAWEPLLYRRTQSVAARETRAAGIDWVFAPMSDLARDPRWGRVSETCGEDPYLTSLCVAEAVRGFQGIDPGADGQVAACLKHFVGYGASVGGRDYNRTEIPDFMLRNQFLPPFKAGVDAGACTVMSSFNANDGIPATANHHTLTDILRGEWGFKGLVVCDWDAILETIEWGYAADPSQAAQVSLSAGTDMEMISTTYRDTIPTQIQKGLISPALVDEAARRVLTLKFKMGLFEHPYADASAYKTAFLHPEDRALARESAVKSCVLLKNNGILPLSKKLKSLALVGPFGDNQSEMLGAWIGHGHAEDVVTLAQGIRTKLPNVDLQVIPGCGVMLNGGSTHTLTDGSIVQDSTVRDDLAAYDAKKIKDAAKQAAKADAIIMALGEPAGWSGENASRATLGVTGRQEQLFHALADTGKPLVVILFSGRPLSVPEMDDESAALLMAWQPGVEAGNALADLLFGDASPSGRLTMSVPRDTGQLPVYYNYDNTGRPDKGFYRDDETAPLYQFGYGLTYSTFSYGPVKILPATGKNPAIATALITNTGKCRADEVVQLYIRSRYSPEGARPSQELRGFQHLVLNPGQKQEVHFPLTDQVLGLFDRKGNWRVDGGDYYIWIAPSAHTGEPVSYEHAVPVLLRP